MQVSGADVVVECLKAEDVTHVFGVVGSSILDLMDSLARSPQIRPIIEAIAWRCSSRAVCASGP